MVNKIFRISDVWLYKPKLIPNQSDMSEIRTISDFIHSLYGIKCPDFRHYKNVSEMQRNLWIATHFDQPCVWNEIQTLRKSNIFSILVRISDIKFVAILAADSTKVKENDFWLYTEDDRNPQSFKTLTIGSPDFAQCSATVNQTHKNWC